MLCIFSLCRNAFFSYYWTMHASKAVETFECNIIKVRTAYKELSLHLDRLHSSWSIKLWALFSLIWIFTASHLPIKSCVHCSRQPQFAMPAMSQPQRWPCSQTGMPYSARNWTIFSLWNHKRAPTLLCSVKLQLDINVTAISHIKYLPPHHVCVPRHAMCVKGVI